MALTYGIHPEHRDVQHPDTIKVDKHVQERPALVVRFHKGTVPVDLVKLHETLRSWHIHEPGL
jgi:hypothetical protein